MKKEAARNMELIREYTLPHSGFTYCVVRLDDGKEITYGKKAYDEIMKKGKR